MKRSSFITTILVVLVIGALVVFVTTLSRALIAPLVEPEIPTPQSENNRLVAASSTLPARLIIPSLGVDTNIQYVGISKHGTMAVPTNYTDVAWYKYGAIPGQAGNAVMAGHVDNGFGLPGVFKHLSELKTGDEIIVEDARGMRLHFIVTKTSAVDATSTDSQTVFGESDTANLNLITCEGVWIPAKKMYSERRVVYATLTQSNF